MTWNHTTGSGSDYQPRRRHSMADRQHAVAHKHVVALSALKVYPGHMPLDGLCLDELTVMGLIRPVKDGYILTPRGLETLNDEVGSLRWRHPLYQDA